MKLLFLTEISPFPAFGGEKIRTAGLLNLFENLHLQTLAVIGNTAKNQIIPDYDNIKFRFFNYPRHSKGRWGEAFSIFFRDKSFKHLIEEIISDFQPDIAYIDYYFYGQYISQFRKHDIPVIYGTHNAQSKLFLQRPYCSFRNKVSNKVEYLIYAGHERLFYPQADALIAVSSPDIKFYNKFIPSSKLHKISNFVNEKDYFPYHVAKENKENYIIMTGNFSAYQNVAGLKWFLEKIWDDELASDTRLVISGQHSMEILQDINSDGCYKKVEALGMVDDIKPYLARARAAIVPLLHGSGTRLKCIEAMALKTQIVSTSKGAEGIDHDNSIVISDTPAGFKQGLYNIIEGKTDYTDKAYKSFINTYSLAPNMKIFENIIHTIYKKRV